MIFILSIAEKASGLMFCSRLKIYVSMVLTLAFVFKIIRPIIFSAVKKVSFPQKLNFSWSRKFSTFKEFFFDQEIFLQSNSFSTVKEFFHNKGISPQSKKFSLIKEFLHIQRSFPWSRNFSTVKKFFYRQLIFLQSSFPKKKFTWSTKFSTSKEVFHKNFFFDQGSFPQTNILTQSKTFFANSDQKGS